MRNYVSKQSPLAQLKQQIEASKEYVAGVVKASDKAFGFLECDKKAILFHLRK